MESAHVTGEGMRSQHYIWSFPPCCFPCYFVGHILKRCTAFQLLKKKQILLKKSCSLGILTDLFQTLTRQHYLFSWERSFIFNTKKGTDSSLDSELANSVQAWFPLHLFGHPTLLMFVQPPANGTGLPGPQIQGLVLLTLQKKQKKCKDSNFIQCTIPISMISGIQVFVRYNWPWHVFQNVRPEIIIYR